MPAAATVLATRAVIPPSVCDPAAPPVHEPVHEPAHDRAPAPAPVVRSGRPARASVTGLVESARAGDAGAWRALTERYTAMMWSVTQGFRLDHATRADVVQAAWVALAEHLHRVRDPEAVGGWLAQTVRRGCLHEVCRLRRVDLRDDFGERDVVDPAPTPDERAEIGDRDRRLRRAFSRLPERDRRLLSLLSASPPARYAQISSELGIPVGSIGPTRARSLGRLRVQLAAEGIGDLVATG